MTHHNPYAAPASNPDSIPHGRMIQSGLLRGLIGLQVLVIVAALGAEAYKHETIVGSGPVFSAVGLAIAFVAHRNRHYVAAAFGWTASALSLLIVFLINYNSWGPPEGDQPITTVCWVYSTVAIPFAGWLIFAQSQPDK